MEELLRILPIEDIAAMLDKTPEEIAAMMDEAAAKGYIRGYETLVDWEQAGVNLVEAVIELRVTPHKARGFDDIGMTIAQFDEVDTVLLMSGSYDLQVIIKGRSFQEIAIFVAKRLSPLDDVLSTATSFVLRPYKRGGRLYLAEEPDERECTVLEPDFKTPWSVRDAGIRSLELGRTKYTANSGLKELRGEICNYLQRRFDLHYKEENVLVTVGGSEAIDLTIRAVVQPGDEVIIPEPCFVCYEPITQLTGGVPVHIATRAEDQFRLTADQLRAAITPRTKALVLNSPNNPTGTV